MLRQLVELPEGETKRAGPPKNGPRKSADYAANVRHWSELCDAPISPDAMQYVRTDTRLALCGALVAKDAGRFAEYHHATYRARWAEPRDLSQPEAVHQQLAAAGLDADEALARAQSEEIGDRLQRDTNEVIERGAFGVPTIFVGDEMFWGNDRFELVRHYLQREA